MVKRYLDGEIRLDSGKTVAECSVCHLQFATDAPTLIAARAELKTQFEAHTCLSERKAQT